jgi:hypothetical protein
MRLVDAKLSSKSQEMKEFNLVEVPKESIEGFIEHISELSGIPIEDLHPVGSTGKVETSNDIDVAVDENKYTPFRIHDKIAKAIGEDYAVYNKGTRVGSYAIPVGGNYRVKIDLMFVENVEWARFAYFSAGDKSKYKGAVRAILLSAVAASIEEPGVDAFHYIDGELIVRVGRGIDLGRGMKRLFQMRPHKKYGEGYIKSLKNVDPEEIRQMHPKLEFDDNDVVVTDPHEVVQILFGPGTRPSNVDTAEEVLDLINRFQPGKRKKILNIAKIRARELAKKGFELPEELQ